MRVLRLAVLKKIFRLQDSEKFFEKVNFIYHQKDKSFDSKNKQCYSNV